MDFALMALPLLLGEKRNGVICRRYVRCAMSKTVTVVTLSSIAGACPMPFQCRFDTAFTAGHIGADSGFEILNPDCKALHTRIGELRKLRKFLFSCTNTDVTRV